MMAAEKRVHKPSIAFGSSLLPCRHTQPCDKRSLDAQVHQEGFHRGLLRRDAGFQRCLQKTWLSPALQVQRLAWAKTELAEARPPVWYFNNLVWLDPCYTITPAKAADLEQPARGTKRAGTKVPP